MQPRSVPLATSLMTWRPKKQAPGQIRRIQTEVELLHVSVALNFRVYETSMFFFFIGFHCSGAQKTACRIPETVEGFENSCFMNLWLVCSCLVLTDVVNVSDVLARFAMFLIARVGAQIYDTGLIHPIDRFHANVLDYTSIRKPTC